MAMVRRRRTGGGSGAHDTLDSKSEKRPVQSAALVKALALNMEGKTEQALREVRAAIENGEALPELDWTEAHLEFQLGQYRRSSARLREGAGDASQSQGRASTTPPCAWRSWSALKRPPKSFRKAVRTGSQARRSQAGLGRSASCICNHPEEALAAFEECLKAKPGYDKALYGKAVALQLLGRTDEAMQFYVKLLPANGANAELLTNMIGLALKLGDDAKVREYCEKLLRVRPGARAALGRTGRSRHRARRLQDRGPTRRATGEDRAGILRSLVQPGSGLSKDQSAGTGRPSLFGSHQDSPGKRTGLCQSGRYAAGARRSAGSAQSLRARPADCARPYRSACGIWPIVFERLGNTEEAEKCMEKLVENEPEREDAWFRLGYFRLLRGDYAGSIEPFRNCVSKRPDWLEALINLGLAQWRSGQLEAAKASLVQAVARHPKSTDALRALAAVIVDMGDYILALDIETQAAGTGRDACRSWPTTSASCCSGRTCTKRRPAPIAAPPKRSRVSPKPCSIWDTR